AAALVAGGMLALLAGTTVSIRVAMQASSAAAAATKEAKRAYWRSYVSDIRQVPRTWEESRFFHMKELLDAQCPGETGGTDCRGFEWHYWRRRHPGWRTWVPDAGPLSVKELKGDPARGWFPLDGLRIPVVLSSDGTRVVGGPALAIMGRDP